ncbi:MAG: GGDEF domain-containing protein [Actinomycetota bacterium]
MSDDPSNTATDAALDHALLAGRLAVLVPAIRKSMFTSVLSITVFSALLARFDPAALGLWLALRLAVSAGCVAGLRRLERAAVGGAEKVRWLAVIMGVSGVVWGAIPAFVRPDAPEWQAVVVLWLFGNQAVVTAVGTPDRSVFLAAIGSVTLVGAATIAIGGGGFGLVLGAILILGGAYSVAIFASLHRTSETAIAARWEAGRLATSLASRQAELESSNERLADLAAHDSLTRLLNRRALTERLTGGREDETLIADGWIGFIDVDHFKDINDTYGHRAGDEVLVALAGRWAGALDAEATLARAGGDEFIVALPSMATGEAAAMAEGLVAALVHPVKTTNDAVQVSCSIGLTAHRADETLAAVLARADEALYQVKVEGRDGWALADAGTDQADEDRGGATTPAVTAADGPAAADVDGEGVERAAEMATGQLR